MSIKEGGQRFVSPDFIIGTEGLISYALRQIVLESGMYLDTAETVNGVMAGSNHQKITQQFLYLSCCFIYAFCFNRRRRLPCGRKYAPAGV